MDRAQDFSRDIVKNRCSHSLLDVLTKLVKKGMLGQKLILGVEGIDYLIPGYRHGTLGP